MMRGWRGPRGICPVCGKEAPFRYSRRVSGMVVGTHPAVNPPPLTDDPASMLAQKCAGTGRSVET